MDVFKVFKWFGLMGGIVYWFFVVWSISRNGWFFFFYNVFSDFGDLLKVLLLWIYNYGLIVMSIFVFVFVIYFILSVKNKF